jgi:hypothetical protein
MSCGEAEDKSEYFPQRCKGAKVTGRGPSSRAIARDLGKISPFGRNDNESHLAALALLRLSSGHAWHENIVHPNLASLRLGARMIPFRIPTTKAVFSLCARGEIERRGRLRYIINTEPHGDHWTGNAFFNIPLVAQEGVMTCILGTDLAAHVARVAPRVMQLNVANLYDYVTGAGIHAPR